MLAWGNFDPPSTISETNTYFIFGCMDSDWSYLGLPTEPTLTREWPRIDMQLAQAVLRVGSGRLARTYCTLWKQDTY
jgi:hypothetical protein